MRNPVITLANDFHHENPVVSLSFEKDFALIAKVKSLNGAAWSQSQGFLYIAKSNFKMEGGFRCKMRNLLDDGTFSKKTKCLHNVPNLGHLIDRKGS